MKRMYPAVVLGAAFMGYTFGYATKPDPQPVLTGHFDDRSMIPSAFAQSDKPEVMPFGFNSPHQPPLAPDAPPLTYWNIDDIRKAHTELAERASKALAQ